MISGLEHLRLIHCPVCLEWKPTEESWSYNCGHCVCRICDETMKGNQPRKLECPECRQSVYKFWTPGGHPIYESIPESQETADSADESEVLIGQTKHVASGLRRMGSSSTSNTVDRAALELKKAAACLEANETLIEGLRDFSDRIQPLFTECQQLRSRLSELEGDRNVLLSNNTELIDENTELKQAIQVADRSLRKARRENEELTVKHEDRLALEMSLVQAEKSKCEASREVEAVRSKLVQSVEAERDAKLKATDYKQQLDVARKKLSAMKSAGRTQEKRIAELEEQLGRVNDSRDDSLRILPLDSELHSYEYNVPSSRYAALPAAPSQAIIEFDTEGIPLHGFRSDHNLPLPPPKRKRIHLVGEKENKRRGLGFPIVLDEKGKAKRAVQIGSRTGQNFS